MASTNPRVDSGVYGDSTVRVACCNLNQWALDFEGNYQRIRRSIIEAKKRGCRLRTGPELEVTGYSCEDHFLERDTTDLSWLCMGKLLKDRELDDILFDVGLPVIHAGVIYNCRCFCLNGKVLCLRPKVHLAADGNYRECRWFTAWQIDRPIDTFILPYKIQAITDQEHVPFGFCIVRTRDTMIAAETCEELFTPRSPHIAMSLQGVEIFLNGSGSHHQLRKLSTRIDLIKSATAKSGGAYLYSNLIGCDGARLYFDGCSMIYQNGDLLAQAAQFSLEEMELVVADVCLEDIRAFRSRCRSRCAQAAEMTQTAHIVEADITLGVGGVAPSEPIQVYVQPPMEEIAFGPTTWLWDYLRRSGMRGFFIPLSGGADSSSVCAMVGIMTRRVVDAVKAGDKHILSEVRKITRDKDFTPRTPQELCNRILCTCYMASKYSGNETRERAMLLAHTVGAKHASIFIDDIVTGIHNSFGAVTFHPAPGEKVPTQKKHPKDEKVNPACTLAEQNIQARTRMVMAYYLSQTMLWSLEEPYRGGGLLVLGAANVDEAIRGYYTKYDCSAADINPIGGINKGDLKEFLHWTAVNEGYTILARTADAAPSAELTGAEGEQSDEKDMGMSYAELGALGSLRKTDLCGPMTCYDKLRREWARTKHKPSGSIRRECGKEDFEDQVAQKVKDFYVFQAMNRHKMTTLTPSYHAENYSPDDNRFDLRPFLYNLKFEWQFEGIDKMVKAHKEAKAGARDRSRSPRKAGT